jgi:hypothetical protein
MKRAQRDQRTAELDWLRWLWTEAERWRPSVPAGSGGLRQLFERRSWTGPELTPGEQDALLRGLRAFAGALIQLPSGDVDEDDVRAVLSNLHGICDVIDGAQEGKRHQLFPIVAMPSSPFTPFVIAFDRAGNPYGFMHPGTASLLFQEIARFMLARWRVPRRCDRCGSRFFAVGRRRWCSRTCGGAARVSAWRAEQKRQRWQTRATRAARHKRRRKTKRRARRSPGVSGAASGDMNSTPAPARFERQVVAVLQRQRRALPP